MTVHLSKLAVGCDSIATLAARQLPWTIKRDDGKIVYRHRTRYLPKRADEIKDGGSMYWIVKHAFLARQPVIDFELIGEGKESFVLVHLAPKLVPVLLTPRRFHQGWRYLEAADAPIDMSATGVQGLETLPPKLLRELRVMGLM
jgi:hypothetical protein